MTNPDTMAVPPSNSPGLIRLRLPSQQSTTTLPQSHNPPDSSPQLQQLEQSLRQLIQSLLETAIMVHDLEGGSNELLFQKIDELTLNLQDVQRSGGNVKESIPEDVLAYVEDGLNPDKYTRRFVNMLMKDNQYVNGKIDAVQGFRDSLAEEIRKEFPELESYVDEVIENTGGVRAPREDAKHEDATHENNDNVQVD